MYYGDNNYEDFLTIIIDKPVASLSLSGIQWNFKFIRLSFISVNKLLSIRLNVVKFCKDFVIKCYDGPEDTSPLITQTNNISDSTLVFSSSYFHLVCKLKTSDKICKSSKLLYTSQNANFSQCGIKMYTTSAWIKEVCASDTFQIDMNATNNNIVWIDGIYPFSPGEHFLIEQNTCMYGGLYIFTNQSGQDIKEVWSFCEYGFFKVPVNTVTLNKLTHGTRHVCSEMEHMR